MPPGMPVATVGAGRGDNAAILAGQMLSLADDDVASRISQYRDKRAKQVLLDDAELRSETLQTQDLVDEAIELSNQKLMIQQ